MKNFIFTLFILGNLFYAKSQEYFHGLGMQYDYYLFSSVGSLEAYGVPGIMYKSTLMLTKAKKKKPNFALSAYPSVGFSLGSGDAYVGASLPILGEMYLKKADRSCFFIGAGFMTSFLSYSDGFGGGGGLVIGPHAGLGGQFEFRDKLVGVRAAYTYGINKTEYTSSITNQTYSISKSLVGLGFFYVLGQ